VSQSTPLDLSIIIVNWNVRDLLEACLHSIERSLSQSPALRAEVIVIDSASADGSVDMIRSWFPEVRLLAAEENIGFTRGNNIGFEIAGGRHLLMLNPDTEIHADALAQMAAYLDAHPDVGIVGPHTLNSDGTHQSTRRRFPTVRLAFFESTWFQGYAPRALLDHFYARDLADDATAEVDWVQGSALMARREVVEQIGGLDPGYVMYSEELDWCRRAKQAGWRVMYLGTITITHHGGKSSDQVTARSHIHFQSSKLRYFRKHHGRSAAAGLRAFLLATYAWQIALEGVKSLLGSKRPMRRARIQAYWQVLRSGLKVS
jgi:hypothetical protein